MLSTPTPLQKRQNTITDKRSLEVSQNDAQTLSNQSFSAAKTGSKLGQNGGNDRGSSGQQSQRGDRDICPWRVLVRLACYVQLDFFDEPQVDQIIGRQYVHLCNFGS